MKTEMKMKNSNDLVPGYAVHPGELLLDEIQAMEMKQSFVAKQLGMKNSQLNEIIKGKRGINATIALRLEVLFGINAQYWMNAQSSYQIDKIRVAKRRDETIYSLEKMKHIASDVPLQYFRKQGALDGDPIDELKTVEQIYGGVSVADIQGVIKEKTFAYFRKSSKLKVDVVNLVGWVQLAKFNLANETVGDFSLAREGEVLEDLKVVIAENVDVLNRCKIVLSSFGIKLGFLERSPQAPVDGLAFYSGGKPAITMTLRHKRLDNFAFTLFHELGHVFRHLQEGGKDLIDFSEKNEGDAGMERMEIEADKFAIEALIPENVWLEFIGNVPKGVKERDQVLIELAEKVGVHPSIALGRWSHETGAFRVRSGINRKLG